jgi:Na+/H+-dicarboxylate symporter
MKIIDIIMLFSPYGVFCFNGVFNGRNPDFSTLRALGIYGLTVVLGLFIMAFIFILPCY